MFVTATDSFLIICFYFLNEHFTWQRVSVSIASRFPANCAVPAKPVSRSFSSGAACVQRELLRK